MRSAYDVAHDLLVYVKAALTHYQRDAITTEYVVMGEVPFDDCCGTLVVGFDRIYRSTDFPVEAPLREACWGGQIVVSVVVLLVRCVPVANDSGTPPSSSAADTAFRSLYDDAAIVWNACAEFNAVDPLRYDRAALAQTFIGQQGGCVASRTTFLLGLDDAWCPVEPEPEP